MNIQVNVINQKLRIASNIKNIVAGTQEFVRFEFDFDEGWDKLTVFAQFRQGDIAYNKYLDENNGVYLPPEIVPGECMMMLYGTRDLTIATTNYVNMNIDENMLVKNASSVELTEPLYNQLVEKVHRASLPYIAEDGNWYYDNVDTGISALGGIVEAKEDALNSIDEAKTNSLNNISQAGDSILDDVSSAKENALSLVETACEDRISEIDMAIQDANHFTQSAEIGEAERVSAENERTRAENTREQQEASRQQSEKNREEKENERNDAEDYRNQAEQLRNNAESVRKANEDKRISAELERDESEAKRQDSESIRNAAEQSRSSAEDLRKENELERGHSEEARKQAEIDRNNEHDIMIDQGNQMIEKIKNMSAGVSPTVDVSGIDGGHRVSITDVDGTETFDIMDGSIGEDGIGIASIEQTTTSTDDDGNNVITITLTNEKTYSFSIKNGSKGNDGAPNEIDNTLSISGAAAEASITGSKINNLTSAVNNKVTKGSVSLDAIDDGAGNVTLTVLSNS